VKSSMKSSKLCDIQDETYKGVLTPTSPYKVLRELRMIVNGSG